MIREDETTTPYQRALYRLWRAVFEIPEEDEDDDDDDNEDGGIIPARLEELRIALRAERISYGELAELQSLADHIDPDDVELLEAAGIPEHDD